MMPPLCFIPLVHPDEGMRARALEHCKNIWSCLQRLEKTALVDTTCASFTRNLQVSLHQLIRLDEQRFEPIPQDTSADVREYSMSLLSSLICEEGINKLRATAHGNRALRMNPVAAYHCLSMGPGAKVLTEFGRAGMEISPTARAASPGQLPKNTFQSNATFCIIPSETLDELCDPKQSWPSLAPQSIVMQGMAFQLMMHFKGEWGKMEHAFLNLLLIPGTVILKPGELKAKMVLSTTQYGAWLYRVEVLADKFIKYGPDAAKSLEFVCIEKPKEWRVCGVVAQAKSQAEGSEAASPSTRRLAPQYSAQQPTPVLKAAARRGFRGMTVPQLRSLWTYLEVEGTRPATEAPIVAALCRFVMGPEVATDGFVKNAMLARHCVEEFTEERLDETKLFSPEPDSFADLVFEDDPELLEQYTDLKEAKEERARAQADRLKTVFPLQPLASAQPQSSAEQRKTSVFFCLVEATGLPVEEGRLFLPPGYAFSKDSTRENRWILRGKELGGCGTKTQSYGKRSDCSDFQAMYIC